MIAMTTSNSIKVKPRISVRIESEEQRLVFMATAET
jgi:hypothetical protein